MVVTDSDSRWLNSGISSQKMPEKLRHLITLVSLSSPGMAQFVNVPRCVSKIFSISSRCWCSVESYTLFSVMFYVC